MLLCYFEPLSKVECTCFVVVKSIFLLTASLFYYFSRVTHQRKLKFDVMLLTVLMQRLLATVHTDTLPKLSSQVPHPNKKKKMTPCWNIFLFGAGNMRNFTCPASTMHNTTGNSVSQQSRIVAIVISFLDSIFQIHHFHPTFVVAHCRWGCIHRTRTTENVQASTTHNTYYTTSNLHSIDTLHNSKIDKFLNHTNDLLPTSIVISFPLHMYPMILL